MSETSERIEIRSDTDDLLLAARLWRPAGRIRGSVVIAHGMGEHAIRYDTFAARLAATGLQVLAPDHRGHGASPGPEGHGDFGPGGWEALVTDLGQWLERARQDAPGVPQVLLGHSMGSLAAQQYACEQDEALAGLILSGSTCFDLLPVPEEETAGLAAFNAPFEPARTPFDWLSRDPEQVDRYIDDPLCGFDASAEAMTGMLGAAARIATPAALKGLRADLPVLLMAGDADSLNAGGSLIEALARRWREAGVTHVDVQLYPEGRHEMLNEINRDEVMDDLAQWIDTRIDTRIDTGDR